VNAGTLRALSWISRIVLGGIFIYSGYTKLQAELQFAAAIAAYRLLPEAWLLPVATYLPWLEVILGALVLTSLKTRWVAGATAGLLAFFIVILTITYLRGIEADCGCFGMGERISPLTILRDSLFLVPALFLTLGHRLRRPEPGPV
jgi:putative oxidoreductase